MWLPSGGGYRSSSWDPIRDGNVAESVLSDEQRLAIFGPKCPVIDITQLRAARAMRVARGGRRPVGGSAA